MNRCQITLEDAKKYQDLISDQFRKIARSEVMSREDLWQELIRDNKFHMIPQEWLPRIKSIFIGKPIITIEFFRDQVTKQLKTHHYCFMIGVLYELAEGNLIPELTQHSLKITADVLNQEAQSEPNA
tara:strand:- start:2604 stop:2984 length:381 start_codon:yes stop_codon:yes gene_type:complete